MGSHLLTGAALILIVRMIDFQIATSFEMSSWCVMARHIGIFSFSFASQVQKAYNVR